MRRPSRDEVQHSLTRLLDAMQTSNKQHALSGRVSAHAERVLLDRLDELYAMTQDDWAPAPTEVTH